MALGYCTCSVHQQFWKTGWFAWKQLWAYVIRTSDLL